MEGEPRVLGIITEASEEWAWVEVELKDRADDKRGLQSKSEGSQVKRWSPSGFLRGGFEI